MTSSNSQKHRGAMSFYAGLAAEGRIAQDYEQRGFIVIQQRWRGKGGEIDLIVKDGDGLIFVEVKQSRSFGGGRPTGEPCPDAPDLFLRRRIPWNSAVGKPDGCSV